MCIRDSAWTTLIFGLLLYYADKSKVSKNFKYDLNTKNILIIGGGNIGLNLAKMLETNFEYVRVKIIEKNMVAESYIAPITNFIKKYGKFALIILMLISLYRIADVVMGVMANIFYLEKGYSIKDIATYSKFFGVFATIIGGLLGGYFASKKGTMTALFLGALIASLSNLLFAWLATVDANINYLIMVITADNISSGFAGAAFVIYLSGLTSIKFTATQYALFSSIMLFLPKLIAGYSGAWVDVMGYSNYFILTALLGMPVLFLIYWIGIIAPVKDK